MGFNTAAGSTLSIGTTALVGATDTYAVIGEITGVPKFGRKYTVVTHKPLSSRATQKVKGSYDDGDLMIPAAKDTSDVGQAAAIVALDVDSYYNFKLVDNDAVPALSVIGVSMTAASPGVVTDTAHGLAVNTPVKLVPIGGGVLPTGIVSGTTYYVKTVATADTYTLSATAGGTVINTTGSPSGTYTRSTVPAATFQYFKALVTGYESDRPNVDGVIAVEVSLAIKSGSIVETSRIPLT